MLASLFILLLSSVRAQNDETPPTLGCYASVNELLAGNSFFRADAFLVQVNQFILNSPSGAITPDLVARACSQGGPDAVQFCSLYSTSPSFLAALNTGYSGILTGLRDCLQVYVAGGPDYDIDYLTYTGQVDFTPSDTTTPVPSQRKRAKPDPVAMARSKRWSVINERVKKDTVAPMTPVKRTFFEPGPMKSRNNTHLEARQSNNCRNTADCFSTCPSCAVKNLLCNNIGEQVVDKTCEKLGEYIEKVLRRVLVRRCLAAGIACFAGGGGPGASVICYTACAFGIPVVARFATEQLCSAGFNCERLTGLCTACSAANNNVCQEGTTECCAGETGTQCGAGCCCCPQCQAPQGPNCACAAAPC